MNASVHKWLAGSVACALLACALAGVAAGLASPASSDAKPRPSAGSKLLFAIGPEADAARGSTLARQSHLSMLTSWYNGSGDLSWMTAWRTTVVPRAYRDGYALHLIVFSDDPEVPLSTRYGLACGRAYPLGDHFLGDMRQLAGTFAGSASDPPLYVTLFTEFQTYPCMDNAWARNAATRAYYLALKDRYRATSKIFHKLAPNAQVSLGWGGWQADFDDPAHGGGRSMFCHFADVMADSDIQSFQAMDSEGNVDSIGAMTRTLGTYGPVMLAHLKPDNGSQATFDADVHTILRASSLKRLRKEGLFALSFMDSTNLDGQPATLDFVARSVSRFGLGSATKAKIESLMKSARRASDPKRHDRRSRTLGGRNSCRSAAPLAAAAGQLASATAPAGGSGEPPPEPPPAFEPPPVGGPGEPPPVEPPPVGGPGEPPPAFELPPELPPAFEPTPPAFELPQEPPPAFEPPPEPPPAVEPPSPAPEPPPPAFELPPEPPPGV